MSSLPPLLSDNSLAKYTFARHALESQDSPYSLRMASSLARDCLEIARELGIGDAGLAIAKVRTVVDLVKLHDSWSERFLKLSRRTLVQKRRDFPLVTPVMRQEGVKAEMPGCIHDRYRMRSDDSVWGTAVAIPQKHPPANSWASPVFPPPPFPGNQDIQPIMTHEELLREGLEMEHCVGSYKSRVMREECYIYRVLSPMRATLEICLKHSPRIGQLKGVSNFAVNTETRAFVRAWFRSVL